jgi:hypothetical protein
MQPHSDTDQLEFGDNRVGWVGIKGHARLPNAMSGTTPPQSKGCRQLTNSIKPLSYTLLPPESWLEGGRAVKMP